MPRRAQHHDEEDAEEPRAAATPEEHDRRDEQRAEDQPLQRGEGNLRPEADAQQPGKREGEERHPCPLVDDRAPATCSAPCG